MDTKVIKDCLNLALQGRLTFPETVQRLKAIGIERYSADLTRLEKMHYDSAGNSHNEPIALSSVPQIGQEFCEAGIKDALTQIQQKEIDYAEFLRRIMRAGTVGYTVYIEGAKAIYFGRKGEFWIEPFPAAARPTTSPNAKAKAN